MRKWISIVALMLLTVQSVSAQQQARLNDFMLEKSRIVAQRMCNLAATPEFVRMFTDRISVDNLVKKWSTFNPNKIEDAYAVEGCPEFYKDVFTNSWKKSNAGESNENEVPNIPLLYDEIERRFSLGTMVALSITGEVGEHDMNVANIMQTSETFIAPRDWYTRPAAVLLTNKGTDIMVMVTFTNTGSGIVTAQARFIPTNFRKGKELLKRNAIFDDIIWRKIF